MIVKRLSIFLGSTLAMILLLAITNVQAVQYSEIGDAGELVPTAQVVGGGYNGIRGYIANGEEDAADMFKFCWGGGDFYAQTFGAGEDDGHGNYQIDTVLWLFDENGVGLAANDDDGPDTDWSSYIEVSGLPEGRYNIAVTDWWSDPLDEFGEYVFQDWDETPAVNTNPVAAWDYFGNSSGFYRIRFESLTGQIVTTAYCDEQVVPEPTTIALLGIGLVGLAGAEVRRRRKKKAIDKS